MILKKLKEIIIMSYIWGKMGHNFFQIGAKLGQAF